MTKLYVASNIPHSFPRKLQKPSTVNERVRKTADTFILDSGIGDDVSNAEVLALAREYNADYVIAKDYLHDHEATIEGVCDFLVHYEDTDPIPMLPLQPPYAEHYQKFVNRDLTEPFEHIVLGGMVGDDITNAQRIRWIRKANEAIPESYHVHGLGIGGSFELVRALAGTDILDSVDCATPEMAAINGAVLDARARQQTCMAFGGGEGRRKRTEPLSAFNAWQIQDVWDREATNQTGLGNYY